MSSVVFIYIFINLVQQLAYLSYSPTCNFHYFYVSINFKIIHHRPGSLLTPKYRIIKRLLELVIWLFSAIFRSFI